MQSQEFSDALCGTFCLYYKILYGCPYHTHRLHLYTMVAQSSQISRQVHAPSLLTLACLGQTTVWYIHVSVVYLTLLSSVLTVS